MERATHHLLRRHATRLDAELSLAHVEEVLEGWSEQVNDEDVVQPFLAKVVDLGDAGWKVSAGPREPRRRVLTTS
jgi:hypothetical protein